MAQHRRRRLHPLASGAQRGSARTSRWPAFLWPRPLQPPAPRCARCIDYLEKVDPEAAKIARRTLRLPGALGRPSRDLRANGHLRRLCPLPGARCWRCCATCMQRQFRLPERSSATSGSTLLQNARLVKNAEAYYRVMYEGAAESWNLRDTHMFETLSQLLDAKGPRSKAIVWAHNSHIGDAAHTDMGNSRGELNIGQLCKEKFDAKARLIGFGTHTGTVAAADDWDEPMQVKQVRPSLDGQSRTHVSRQRREPLPAGPEGGGDRPRIAGSARRGAARAFHRCHLPPRDGALEPLFRMLSCTSSSTPGSGSTKPKPSPRCPAKCGRAKRRPIRSACNRRIGLFSCSKSAASIVNQLCRCHCNGGCDDASPA